MSIGYRIKQVRQHTHLNQKRFAEAIGISQGNLSDIERGKFSPSVETIISVSRYSNISTDWLLKGTGPGPGEKTIQEAQQKELLPIEREIIDKTRELDDEGKLEVLHFVQYTHYQQSKGGRLSISTSTGEQAATKELA